MRRNASPGDTSRSATALPWRMNTTATSGADPEPATRADPGHGDPHSVRRSSSVTIARSSVRRSTAGALSRRRRASVVFPAPGHSGTQHAQPLRKESNAHGVGDQPDPARRQGERKRRELRLECDDRGVRWLAVADHIPRPRRLAREQPVHLAEHRMEPRRRLSSLVQVERAPGRDIENPRIPLVVTSPNFVADDKRPTRLLRTLPIHRRGMLSSSMPSMSSCVMRMPATGATAPRAGLSDHDARSARADVAP